MPPMGVFNGMPAFMSLFFVVIALIIFGFIAYAVLGGITTWSRNNASPVQTRAATIVAKRVKVWGGSGDTSANTSYFATFEFDDRTRLELRLRGSAYGLLAEGDRGTLTYQGTRFHNFQR